jgi:hypothetical protein
MYPPLAARGLRFAVCGLGFGDLGVRSRRDPPSAVRGCGDLGGAIAQRSAFGGGRRNRCAFVGVGLVPTPCRVRIHSKRVWGLGIGGMRSPILGNHVGIGQPQGLPLQGILPLRFGDLGCDAIAVCGLRFGDLGVRSPILGNHVGVGLVPTRSAG